MKRRRTKDEQHEAPQPDECPSPKAGTRMLVIPPAHGDPMRLAGESIERLKREHPPRVVKTRKGKARKSKRFLPES